MTRKILIRTPKPNESALDEGRPSIVVVSDEEDARRMNVGAFLLDITRSKTSPGRLSDVETFEVSREALVVIFEKIWDDTQTISTLRRAFLAAGSPKPFNVDAIEEG